MWVTGVQTCSLPILDPTEDLDRNGGIPDEVNWRWNSLHAMDEGNNSIPNVRERNTEGTMTQETSTARKRLAMDSTTVAQMKDQTRGALVTFQAQPPGALVNQVQPNLQVNSDPLSTPQKSLNKKKSKGVNGEAITSTVSVDNDEGSAALLESDRREQ